MSVTPGTLAVKDGAGVAQQLNTDVWAGGSETPHQVLEIAGAPVGNTNPSFSTEPIHTFAVLGGSLTLAVTNTAQNAQAANSTPLTVTVVNPFTATEQGIANAESIWVNPTGAAAQVSGGASIPLEPGQSITFVKTVQAVSWVAVTAGHKICGYSEA